MQELHQVPIVELIEDEKLFEFKFVRFAYRYKYKDGQYSAIGPFTEVAFLPQEFDISLMYKSL